MYEKRKTKDRRRRSNSQTIIPGLTTELLAVFGILALMAWMQVGNSERDRLQKSQADFPQTESQPDYIMWAKQYGFARQAGESGDVATPESWRNIATPPEQIASWELK